MEKGLDNPARSDVSALAMRLSREIAERRLAPDDRFMTTDEAARFLHVRRDRANRALQVLAQRGEIRRSQRLGSRVAGPRAEAPPLGRVHVLVQEDHGRDEPAISPGTQAGLHSALPGCEVELRVIPTGGAAEALDPLLRRALRGSEREALVLLRCDYPTQRLVANSGLTTAVYGTTYAGLSIPSVDVDGEQMAGLHVAEFAARGCERIVVMRRDRALPGDRAFMGGLRLGAAGAGFGAGSITELEIAPYPELIRAELGIALEDGAPTGVICGTRPMADTAWGFAGTSGRTIGKDLWIHANHVGTSGGRPPYPFLAPVDDAASIGRRLGELLVGQAAGPPIEVEHQLVPCRLVNPRSPR